MDPQNNVVSTNLEQSGTKVDNPPISNPSRKLSFVKMTLISILSFAFGVICTYFAIKNAPQELKSSLNLVVEEKSDITDKKIEIEEDITVSEKEVEKEPVDNEKVDSGEIDTPAAPKLTQKKFGSCDITFNYDSKVYLYSEGKYRDIIDVAGVAEARIYKKGTNPDQVDKELNIECTDRVGSNATLDALLMGLVERWNNDSLDYEYKIVSKNKVIDSKQYYVIDFTWNSPAVGETKERLYLSVGKREYVIRVTANSTTSYDEVVKEAGLVY